MSLKYLQRFCWLNCVEPYFIILISLIKRDVFQQGFIIFSISWKYIQHFLSTSAKVLTVFITNLDCYNLLILDVLLKSQSKVMCNYILTGIQSEKSDTNEQYQPVYSFMLTGNDVTELIYFNVAMGWQVPIHRSPIVSMHPNITFYF